MINLALAKQLHQDGYDVTMFTSDQTLEKQDRNYPFNTVVLAKLDPDADYVVALTSDKTANIRVANWANRLTWNTSSAGSIPMRGPKGSLKGFSRFPPLCRIGSATEKVRKRDRWYTVSWAFYQLRQMIEYKAKMNRSMVIFADPKYTSQTCPKCGHTEKANRNKKKHMFRCRTCGYTSNDDRIGAMNLHRKGIEYLSAGTVSA